MEDFLRVLTQGGELVELNRLRTFLRSTCLSDQATGNGKPISPTFWIRNPNTMNSQYQYPPQPRPHKNSCENWQAALYSTYKLFRSLSIPYHQLLVPRLPLASTTGWVYSQSQDRVLHLSPKGFSAYRPLIRRQGISSHRIFILTDDEPVQEPPEDSIPTNVE